VLTKIDIRQLDLNLLPKFRALYQRRSVSAAARDLFLTQSAVSNALAKMRHVFRDQLFVRTAEGMVPTSLAHAISDAIEPALGMIEGGLEKAGSFDPEHSGRAFKLAMTQLAEFSLLPHIVRATLHAAPGVRIASVSTTRDISSEDFRSGAVDMAVGISVRQSPAVRSETIGTCRMVAILRDGHVARDADTATLEATCQFIQAEDFGDTTEVSARFRTANMLSLPSLVSGTDLIGIVPEWLATLYAPVNGLVVRESPFHGEPYSLGLAWHASSEHDHGHRWLRTMLAEAVKAAGFEIEPTVKAPLAALSAA
jgi:DNA-binding transcriptional LysR family regulator